MYTRRRPIVGHEKNRNLTTQRLSRTERNSAHLTSGASTALRGLRARMATNPESSPPAGPINGHIGTQCATGLVRAMYAADTAPAAGPDRR